MSKRKGTNYENKISKKIDFYLKKYIPEYKELTELNYLLKVQRDKSSGNDNNSIGDINLNYGLKYFPFTIECKHWKKLNLTLKSLYKNSDFDKILNQVLNKKNSLKNLNLIPLIIFRGNYTEDYVLLLEDDYNNLNLENNFTFKIKTITKKNKKIVILLFDEFIEKYLLWRNKC